MKKYLILTFIGCGISFLPLVADEIVDEPVADTCQCEGEQCEEGCVFYQYFPHNSIFQDSTVREDYDEPPTWSWPGRRDGELSDELSR